MKKLNLESLNHTLELKTLIEIAQWCFETFNEKEVILSTSFGAEGSVILDAFLQVNRNLRVFTIDTGRNFQESYDVWQALMDKYGISIEVYGPDPEELYSLQTTQGPNHFYNSKEFRQNCCHVRKINPLNKALKGIKLWISGLRKSQSSFRQGLEIISYAEERGVYKLAPLFLWEEDTVWKYIRNNQIPYNKLYDKGFATIGCSPCTRPVGRAEELRSGRWWWEVDSNKECGIHLVDGKMIRKKAVTDFSI
ncbi:MAG: phosphoadenylyl-sulfate reductase [Spirochaetales bacterium]|nr:phosphoadenylyl-sulfate reductase [Spirochaetales bacterium]